MKIKSIFLRTAKSTLRSDIQAMRALAVLSVVIYHVSPAWLKGGFAGVDIFFVISGFLMTLHIVNGLENGGFEKGKRFSFFSNFYARRIRRLVPAALFCILSVLILIKFAFVLDLNAQFLTAKQVFSSALFFQNWQLAGDAVDYLSQNNTPTALQHFWSLSVEEQFYFIWPLLLMILMLFGTMFLNNKKGLIKSRNILLIFTVIFTLISFIYGVYATKSNSASAYFITPARIWELSIGGVAALTPPLISFVGNSLKSKSAIKKIVSWFFWEVTPFIGLALCLYTVFFVDSTQHSWPGKFAILPTVGTVIVLWSGAKNDC